MTNEDKLNLINSAVTTWIDGLYANSLHPNNVIHGLEDFWAEMYDLADEEFSSTSLKFE